MTRLSAYILLLSLFLLAACNEEKKEFMTPKPDEPVLDVNVDEYSLNGMVLGKTATDISAIDDVYDNPLHKEACELRAKAQEKALRNNQPGDGFVSVKLHVDENLLYGDFYKSLFSMRSCGYWVFKIAIGSNYKDAFQLSLSTPNYMWCGLVRLSMKALRYKYLCNRQKLSLEEMLYKDVEKRKDQIECVKDYSSLDLLLSFYPKYDGKTYVVSLNETFFNKSRPFDGFNFYTFDNEADLWKFIENLRLKVEPKIEDRQDRILTLLDGRRKIELVFEKDIPMKDIAPIIKKLSGYGYRINFSILPLI
jgi:hypothetical protein